MSTTVTDGKGRKLTLRKLDALAKLRLFKACGPTNAQNQPYLGLAMLASSVASIDDVPVVMPITEQQIESLVSTLGDDGIEAVAEAMAAAATETPEEVVASAKNL